MSQTSTSDIYSFATEYSAEDIKTSIALMEEERQRRLNDTEGENHRRAVAGQVSDLFTSSLRATWFQKGSSFVLGLLSSVKQSGKEMWKSQPVKNLNAKLQVAGQKGVAVAQDVSITVGNKAGEVGQKVQEGALTLKEKSVVFAQGIKEKSVETAQTVSSKTQEKSVVLAKGIKSKSIETAQDAKEKVQELGSRLRSAVTRMSLYKKLNKSFSNLAENANIAFVHLEEENERAWRMSNPNQVWAIYNARAVSQLIKELPNGRYTAESEPSTAFFTRMLEEGERARRVAATETSAINNGKAVSSIITQKFSSPATSTSTVPAAKVEVVDEIKVSRPLVATN